LTTDRAAISGTTGTVPATALNLSATQANWQSADVQAAYAKWLPQRWEQWKANHEEADCKTTAAKLMADFRGHYAETTGQTLPDPLKGKATWLVGTREKPNGITATIPTKGPLRPEYLKVRGKPAIDGPNHRLPGISAHDVAKVYSTNIATRDGQPLVTRSKGEGGYPKGNLRINQDLLQPGDVIFQQHTHPKDDRWDHAMTVVKVERDEQGKTTRLTMGIGSFDDLKDNNAATPPTNLVNFYAYEQVIDFQDGNITDSQITWQSDASLRPIGAGESLDKRIKRAQVILGAEQKLTEVHNWK
jgi:hypothetical protein